MAAVYHPAVTAADAALSARLDSAESGLVQESAKRVAATAADDEWQTGRVWATNFASAARDAAVFDTANLTYTTDGGVSCVRAADTAQVASCMLKATIDVPDCELVMRYRVGAAPQSTAAYMRLAARWLSLADGMAAWDAYNGFLLLEAMTGGSNGFVPPDSGYIARPTNQTDITSVRLLKLRVWDDTLAAKSWFAGSAEPDWQLLRRARPDDAQTDIPGHGLAGFTTRFLPVGTSIHSLSIVELTRRSPNLLRNPNARWRSHYDGRPAPWAPVAGTTDVVEAVGPQGDVRPVFRLQSTGSGSAWHQYASIGAPTPKVGQARVVNYPRIDRPSRFVEVSIWSKGTNVVNPTPSGVNLAACVLVYYYDAANATLQGTVIPAENFFNLGPAPDGLGSWDWFENRKRITIGGALADNENVDRWRWSVLFHDVGAAGEVMFTDFRVTNG